MKWDEVELTEAAILAEVGAVEAPMITVEVGAVLPTVAGRELTMVADSTLADSILVPRLRPREEPGTATIAGHTCMEAVPILGSVPELE